MQRPRWTAGLVLVVILLAGCSTSEPEVSDSGFTVAEGEVAELIDAWWDALDRGDGSVLDLYRGDGLHLYGTVRFEGQNLVLHLQGDGSGVAERITEPMVIEGIDPVAYVVTLGMRYTDDFASWATLLTYEIMRTSTGELILGQTVALKLHDA